VKNEISYDRQQKNADRIYRLTVEVRNPNGYQAHFARSWQTWITRMPEQFPAIEGMARFSPWSKTAIRLGEIKFNSSQVFQVNPEVFKVFDFDLISGNPANALDDPKKMIISESLARKYFNDADVLGKTLDLSGIYDTAFSDFEVTGVFRDFPANSHFHPEILISMDHPDTFQGWAYTYLLLRKGSNAESITDNFREFSEKFLPAEEKDNSKIYLQNIKQIHLYSKKDREIEKNGDAKQVLIFTLIGVTIFLLALINYVNLSIALIIKKKKNLIISKIFGAELPHLFKSFFVESLLFNFFVAIISLSMILMYRNHIAEFITPGYLLSNLKFLMSLSLILCFFSSLAVSVPQLLIIITPFITAGDFVPRQVNYVRLIKSKNSGIKNFLVVAQYTASIVLIISAVFFNKQKNYLLANRLGAEGEPVVVLDNLNWQVKDKYFEFKNRLLENQLIRDVTGSMEEPSGVIMDAMPFEMSGIANDKKDLVLYVAPVDDNFFRFFNLDLIRGHDFTKYSPASSREEYILNETAMKYLGFDDPEQAIGRNFKPIFNVEGIFKGGEIIGVVRDFNFSTMKEKIKPFVLFQKPIWYWTFMVKVDRMKIHESLRYIKSTWDQVYPEYTFDYSFVDRDYQQAYHDEIVQAKLSGYFMILAIVIASLGLFGLASISIEQRTREIGIRKVIGANSLDIIFMLNREFTIWVLISILAGLPIAWIFMRNWSENFAYKATLSWWIFAMAAITILMISWLTISYCIIRASRKNPVEVLKHE
jgi:putative ABC transport system permease protein